ncbi:unnamed protein product [Notodromas monacha]|uniref:J domain-containing protein n=1 Tax=Notodromas monacha TaxID=399045 RepID=A0A7R9BJF4_9CRUS|nr:unnamed protein product [Notodromas monacha]CAG0915231.1 unnamed protein product [Notodromas monacha]
MENNGPNRGKSFRNFRWFPKRKRPPQPGQGDQNEEPGEKYNRYKALEKRYTQDGLSLYATLDVAKEADTEEIRKSYRRKALLYHPDKNIENPEEAAEKFKDINFAYRVLTDEHKRKIYDKHGSLGIKLSEEEGDDFVNAYFFFKPLYRRALATFIFIATLGCFGGFCCCFCCCIFCCNFCCGRCKPDGIDHSHGFKPDDDPSASDPDHVFHPDPNQTTYPHTTFVFTMPAPSQAPPGNQSSAHDHPFHGKPSMNTQSDCKECRPPSVVDDHASFWQDQQPRPGLTKGGKRRA